MRGCAMEMEPCVQCARGPTLGLTPRGIAPPPCALGFKNAPQTRVKIAPPPITSVCFAALLLILSLFSSISLT